MRYSTGEFRIYDRTGMLRGHFKDARMLAVHFAMAMEAIDKLNEARPDASRNLTYVQAGNQ